MLSKHENILCTSSCPYYQTARKGRNLVHYCIYLNKREKTHEGRPCLHPDFLETILDNSQVNTNKLLEEIKEPQYVEIKFRKKHRSLNPKSRR